MKSACLCVVDCRRLSCFVFEIQIKPLKPFEVNKYLYLTFAIVSLNGVQHHILFITIVLQHFSSSLVLVIAVAHNSNIKFRCLKDEFLITRYNRTKCL